MCIRDRVRVTLSGSVAPLSTCSHKYVAPTVVEPAPVRVTVVAVVLRTTVWSGPALATTAPSGVSGPTLADSGLDPLAFFARTVNWYGVSAVTSGALIVRVVAVVAIGVPIVAVPAPL